MSAGNNPNNNDNNHGHYNAYAQIPVDVGKIVADVRNSVESAMRSVPPFNMPPMNFWPGVGGGCPSNHATPPTPAGPSSSGRPPIPAFPKDDEILVQVWTQAIKNSFNLKKSVSISTMSGSIKADIVPSPTPTTELFRKLTTHTNTGSQNITITTSLGPFMMDSSHSTMTGSIKAIYPDDWCGTIELSVTHGSYKLGDAIVVRDVVDQITRERQILALRGNPREGEEFSTMKIVSKTGSVDVRFEKVPPLRDLTTEEMRAEEEEARRRGSSTGFSTGSGSGTSGGGSGGGNKEQKEREGPAVFRPGDGSTAASCTSQPPPPLAHNYQQQQRPLDHQHYHNNHPAQTQVEQHRQVVEDPDDLPPSYEQSEQENVQMQVAGRD